MSHGHIEFYEAVNAAEKTFVIAFNPSTVHEHTKQTFTFTVAKYPGIARAEIYRNMNAVVWFECNMAAIQAAEALKTSSAAVEKITHLHEARKARKSEKEATVVEAHCVRYDAKTQGMVHFIQELTITPLIQLPDDGPTLLRKELLGAVNMQDNGYVLIWLCDPLVNDPENNPPRFLINELFTTGGQPYFTIPGEYLPVQSMRFYSLFGGRRLSADAKVLPDNGFEAVETQYGIVIGQDCPDPKRL